MKTVIELLYLGSILFSAIMAVIYRSYMVGRMLPIMIPYLLLVFVQETVLSFNTEYKFLSSSSIVYNIYQPISATVFSFIYFSIPFMFSVRKLIAGVLIIYLSLVVINYCFIKSIFETSSYLPIARSFVITFCAVLFLFRYFNLDNIKEEKYWQPLVWITAGIAIFYPVVATSLAFQKHLAALNAELFGFKLYRLIPKVMSIFMYNCFSHAFYLCKKIK